MTPVWKLKLTPEIAFTSVLLDDKLMLQIYISLMFARRLGWNVSSFLDGE